MPAWLVITITIIAAIFVLFFIDIVSVPKDEYLQVIRHDWKDGRTIRKEINQLLSYEVSIVKNLRYLELLEAEGLIESQFSLEDPYGRRLPMLQYRLTQNGNKTKVQQNNGQSAIRFPEGHHA